MNVRASLYAERNVHGVLPKEGETETNIIFGVDGFLHRDSERLRRFTKTYRKMMLPEQELPGYMIGRGLFDSLARGESVDCIKIYDHSLGRADYSYFQVLFDRIDLYGSNTVLYFLGAKGYEPDKESVNALIETYSETIESKAHGANLLHKLLLEDCLKIACI